MHCQISISYATKPDWDAHNLSIEHFIVLYVYAFHAIIKYKVILFRTISTEYISHSIMKPFIAVTPTDADIEFEFK